MVDRSEIDQVGGFVQMADVVHQDFHTRDLVGSPSVETADNIEITENKELVEIAKTRLVDTGYMQFAHTDGLIHKVTEQGIPHMERELAGLQPGDNHLVGLFRQRTFDEVGSKIIPVVGTFEDYTRKSVIGFDDTRFGSKRMDGRHVGESVQSGEHRVGGRDGLHLIGIVIIEINYLNMRAEARHLVGDGLLESDDDADGDNHHHYAYDDTRKGNTDGRTRRTRLSLLAAILREIKALGYPYFGF